MNNVIKICDDLRRSSDKGFILLGSTIALFIILSVFSIFLIKVVVKENQISSYNLLDIRTRNLSQSGLDHGIQLFKTNNTPYLSAVSKNLNNGQYTITYDPVNNENDSPLPYSHFAMINSSASINDATRNTRLFVSSYPDAFNLAFFGNRNGTPWNSLNFDGNDRVVVSDNSDLRLTGVMSAEVWFKIDTHSGGWTRVVGKGASGPRNYGLWYHQNGIFLFQQYGSGGGTDARYNTAVQLGQWYHLAAVRDANTAKLYLNGQLDPSAGTDTSPVTTPSTSSDPLTIGHHDWNNQYHRGQIDDVRIWNVARTQTQIQANMYNKLTGNETGLVAYWDFDEGSGNIAYDKTGNGHNANINTATWITIEDPNVESYSQSGGTINGDIYYNGNISGVNLTGNAYTSTGSGGTQHPDPLPEFPVANTAYFSAMLDTISPATGSGGEEEEEISGQLVSMSGTNVSMSVFPSYQINYVPSGASYWWQVKVEFQALGSDNTFTMTHGENTRNSTRSWNFNVSSHTSSASQIIVKKIWIRGDLSASSEYLDNVTIGGHNFGRFMGVGDDGTYDLEYSHDGGSGESTCDGCLALTHGENTRNSTRSWNFDLSSSFNSASNVIIKNIWIRGDFSWHLEYLNNVTIGGHNFGKFDGVGDDGVWDLEFSGNKSVNMSGTSVSASVFVTNDVNYAPGGSPYWWQVKVEFYQEPEPEEESGGPLELTSNFNLSSTYPNGLFYGNDISLTGLTVTGSGRIYATGDIDITNCTIAGGIEIACNGEINISNSTVGSNVNSISNSIVLFSKGGLSISGSNVRGLILSMGTNLTVSGSSNVKGALYTCSTTTNISGSTVTGSIVSKYGVSLNNSTINKGSLPPTYDLSYGFSPMVIPGSYLEY
tara:strand:- start:418 stop:3063 length:2646 start_codon:yes stop_codon:yes gene_type:complete